MIDVSLWLVVFLVIVWGFLQDDKAQQLKDRIERLELTKETYARVLADSYDRYYRKHKE